MAMNANQVALELQLKDNISKGLAHVQRQVQNFAGNVDKSTSNLSRDFARVASSVISVTAAFTGLKKVINEGISFNRFMQEQTTAFSVMLKSADAAKAKIQELYNFAVNTPLTFKETTSAGKQLMAYGFSADELVGSLKTLGTVAKATGHSLSDITYVYGTLRSQGRAYSRDLMQFGMRGIPIYEELSKVMGVGVEELKKMTEEGKVGFKEVELAFKNMTGEGGRFFGMLEEYMNTLSGKLSMFTDIFQQSAGALAKGITDQLTRGLDSMMQTMKDSNTVFAEFGVYLGDIVGFLMGMVEVLIKLIPLIKVFVALLISKTILSTGALVTKMFFGLGDAAVNLALGLGKVTAVMTAGNLATGFSSMVTGIGLLKTQLIGLAPLLAPLVGVGAAIAAVGGGIVSHQAQQQAKDAELMATNPEELMRQKFRIQQRALPGMSLGMEHIQAAATQYNITFDKALAVAKELGLVTEDTLRAIRQAELAAAQRADLAQDRAAQRAPSDAYARAEREARFYSGLTGIAAPKYIRGDRTSTSAVSLGQVAAGDYLQTFENQRALDRRIFQGAYSQDMLKGDLKAEAEAITAALQSAFKVVNFEGTLFDDILIARLQAIGVELDSMGGKAEEVVKSIEMDKWFDREYMVKATEEAYDDIQLQREKDLDNARKRWEEDKDITDEQYDRAVTAIHAIADAAVQAEEARIAAIEQRQALEAYNAIMMGNTLLADDYRRTAGAQFGTKDYAGGTVSSMQAGFASTGFGAFLASTDKAAMALANLGEVAGETASQLITSILDKIGGIDIGASIESISSGVAGFINNIFGLTNATEEYQSTVDVLKAEISSLESDFDILVGRIREMVGAQAQSLQDLYEVGAISGSEYQTQVAALNASMDDSLRAAYEAAGKEYRSLAEIVATDATLGEVYDALTLVATKLGVLPEELETVKESGPAGGTTIASDAVTMGLSGAAVGAMVGGPAAPLTAAIGGLIGAALGGIGGALGWWADGTPEITKDHIAMVHKGETIIPRTFAEGIRAGDLTLTGAGGSSGGGDTINVYLTVEGSVQAEHDLAQTIAEAIYTQRQRGQIIAY